MDKWMGIWWVCMSRGGCVRIAIGMIILFSLRFGCCVFLSQPYSMLSRRRAHRVPPQRQHETLDNKPGADWKINQFAVFFLGQEVIWWITKTRQPKSHARRAKTNHNLNPLNCTSTCQSISFWPGFPMDCMHRRWRKSSASLNHRSIEASGARRKSEGNGMWGSWGTNTAAMACAQKHFYLHNKTISRFGRYSSFFRRLY